MRLGRGTTGRSALPGSSRSGLPHWSAVTTRARLVLTRALIGATGRELSGGRVTIPLQAARTSAGPPQADAGPQMPRRYDLQTLLLALQGRPLDSS